MVRLNELPVTFVIALDDAGRPVGTVTDGDIRRAVLAEKTLEAPISEIMHGTPLIGHINDLPTSQSLLNEVEFLPMVDGDGALAEIWLRSKLKERISTALVMAGGQGTRLGQQTKTQPKPLLDVDNAPILEHVLTWLESGGVENIYISTHYLADKISTFLDARNGMSTPRIIYEKTLLGTAGALNLLPSGVKGPILVMNGDVLTTMDVSTLHDFHTSHGYDCTIAVTPFDFTVPFGVIRYDDQGVFEGIDEKPTFTRFVAAGIYLLGSEFLGLFAPKEKIDMPDLLNLGRQAGLNIGLFPIHEYWIDIGRPDQLSRANKEWKDQK
ncbi:MAG: NTP transferase domain-containing protein [Rhodospirillaceae bacterium]|jgi:UDP-2,4-diacetamido-2,4,6-trideoxy-beta-L-gulopyranose hydrolase|nr:NTP transferase domain-containing protein [Rhodospirillaceae bacterium]MBT5667360.1 NTP transferase domain-containing protein [Rhodospirillaceae bacterium]